MKSRTSPVRMSAFTLVEVLVALAILAIALAAAMRTLHLATDSARDSKLRLLATWVAQNQLAEMTAQRSSPPAGDSSGSVGYAGEKFAWQHTLSVTPNPAFRKIDIRITLDTDTSHALAQLHGYLVRATP